MAGMFITRSALFRFSKSLSLPYAPSLSLKPSTVTFASTPNHSDWRNAADGRRDSRGDWTYDSAEANEMSEKAKETVSEGVDRAKDSAKEAAGTVADKSKEGAEKTEEVAVSAAETLKNVGEKAKQGAQGVWETAKDTTEKIKETVVGKDDDKDGDNGEDVVEVKRRVGKGYGENE